MVTITNLALRKEKNIITIVKNSNEYRYDINTGILYGKKGTPRRTSPLTKREIEDLNYHYGISTNYNDWILYLFTSFLSRNSYFGESYNYKDIVSFFEYLYFATGKRIAPNGYLGYSTLTELMLFVKNNSKSFISYVKKYNNTNSILFLSDLINDYKMEELLNKIIKEFPILDKNDKYIKSIIIELFGRVKYDTKLHFALEIYVKYMILFRKNFSSIISILRRYLMECDELNYPYKNKGDFFKTANDMEQIYLIKKQERDEKQLKENYEPYISKIQYENENYIIVIPTKEKDFEEEGKNQHNCVYKFYYPRMTTIGSNSLIVFIRKKNDISKSYITCEIDAKTGKIIQFLEKYNHKPTEENIIQFKNDYQNFLTKNF